MKHFVAHKHFGRTYFGVRHFAGVWAVVATTGSSYFGAKHFASSFHFRLRHFAIELLTYLRPVSQVSNTGWLAFPGGLLPSTIDEAGADDSDFIYTNGYSVYELVLGPVPAQGLNGPYALRYKLAGSPTTKMITTLSSGTTLIEQWVNDPLTPQLIEVTRELSAGQIALIVPGVDLILKFETLPAS